MANKSKHKSALKEVDGIKPPETIDQNSIKKIQLKKRKLPATDSLLKHIIDGNITYLSRAITLIESAHPDHQKKGTEILTRCLPYTNNSIRIGITGVPGVGKSTFIEAFGTYLTTLGKKVAVLAIDPSSSINKGSILGDKTRMETLVTNKNAFIRPSPSGNSLGGVAKKTRETIMLCEAAGFDIIIIETVGVGQSETAVHSMVDFFLLLKLAGAGDELQGIKRGIIEMADAIVINKADGENVKAAQIAKTEFTRALHLYPPKPSQWQPKVSTCSALTNEGIEKIWSIIQEYLTITTSNGYFQEKRDQQNTYWVLETIQEQLKTRFFQHTAIKKELANVLKQVQENKITPFDAASFLLDLYDKKSEL